MEPDTIGCREARAKHTPETGRSAILLTSESPRPASFFDVSQGTFIQRPVLTRPSFGVRLEPVLSGNVRMTVARFVTVTLALSVVAGLGLGVAGYGVVPSLVGALIVLVALQCAYFAFLMIKAKASSRDRHGGRGDR